MLNLTSVQSAVLLGNHPLHWTIASFVRAGIPAFLAASISFASVAMAGELRRPNLATHSQTNEYLTLVSDSQGAAASPSLAGSLNRPPSLPEPHPNADTLRSHAFKLGLYFGSMMDLMPGNGWETPWIEDASFRVQYDGARKSTEVVGNPSNSGHV